MPGSSRWAKRTGASTWPDGGDSASEIRAVLAAKAQATNRNPTFPCKDDAMAADRVMIAEPDDSWLYRLCVTATCEIIDKSDARCPVLPVFQVVAATVGRRFQNDFLENSSARFLCQHDDRPDSKRDATAIAEGLVHAIIVAEGRPSSPSFQPLTPNPHLLATEKPAPQIIDSRSASSPRLRH